jgi:hypothetical protein
MTALAVHRPANPPPAASPPASGSAGETPAAPPLMTAEELAAMLGCTVRHLLRRRNLGFVPDPIPTLGRRKVWNRDEIIRWFAAGNPDRKTWERIDPIARQRKR